MDYLHERGVKGYVTLNILLFDEELERAEDTIRVIAGSNADAVIVQVCACPSGPPSHVWLPSMHEAPAEHHRRGWHWPCMRHLQGFTAAVRCRTLELWSL